MGGQRALDRNIALGANLCIQQAMFVLRLLVLLQVVCPCEGFQAGWIAHENVAAYIWWMTHILVASLSCSADEAAAILAKHLSLFTIGDERIIRPGI